MVKSASPTTYSAVGQIITYTYNVTNSGNVNITGSVNVTDNKVGTIEIIAGDLIPGQSVTGTGNYTITQADINTGSVTNAAFATGTFGNNTTTSNTDHATVIVVQGPTLTIVKSASPTTYSTVGQIIRFHCKKSGYFTKPVKNITNRIFRSINRSIMIQKAIVIA